ncbi:MAG: 3-isopropylmalate dehydratase small subunit [Chloroflexi bacterium]|nr:3-isopropylmalate dehydratase small subunit [Chloroflexota bacterium]
MKFKGTVFKFGANLDTDGIIPARYLNTSDPAELAKHAMEDADPTFVSRMKKGDIVMATTNFGCGSSREHAPIALKAAGVSCVIAKSFARIFYRNAINIGLPILECDEAVDNTSDGDVLEVELATGGIKNLTTGRMFEAKPYPEFMLQLIEVGGLVEYTRKKIQAKSG